MYEQWVVSGNNKYGKIWNWIPYFSILLKGLKQNHQ